MRYLYVPGYYALNQARMGELQTLFGQLWKEYALSDSRYLTQNAFVLCMESMTAVSHVHMLSFSLALPDRHTAFLGSSILCRGFDDHHAASSAPPLASHGFSRSILR